MTRSTLAALVMAAAISGTAVAIAPIPGAAQVNAQAATGDHAQRMSRHIEGRIAYLKTELKITDAQAPLWDKVAAVMRQNAQALDDAFSGLRRDPNTPPSALASLEARVKLTQVRAQGDEQLLAAFRPLYGALSDDQKKTADEMFGHHHHRR
jgi:periplasmic protein CpxP/Spy